MLNDEYFGKSAKRGELELLTITQLPRELTTKEPRLMRTKWFDYRRMHPAQTTYYWAHCYRKASERFCSISHSLDRVGEIAPLAEDILRSRDVTAAMRARQALDEVGCRYEWAMQFIVDRFIDRGWMSMPRPNQLYGEELLIDLAVAWKLECRASMQIPEHPYYQVDPHDQSTGRKDYADWAFAQVRQRAVKGMEWMPLSTLLRRRVVTRAQIGSEFGAATLARC